MRPNPLIPILIDIRARARVRGEEAVAKALI
jgi:hypothetical protein